MSAGARVELGVLCARLMPLLDREWFHHGDCLTAAHVTIDRGGWTAQEALDELERRGVSPRWLYDSGVDYLLGEVAFDDAETDRRYGGAT